MHCDKVIAHRSFKLIAIDISAKIFAKTHETIIQLFTLLFIYLLH